TFPASIADGSYFIGVIIEISDTNNANNTGHDNTTVTVASPPAAELVLTEVNAPSGSFVQGATISVDAEVSNTGNAASGAFSITYYASTNSSINTSDRLIGTENRASLAAGDNSSGPFNATIPADLAPGAYFIGAIVNFDDSSSADNTNVDNGTITVTASGIFAINNGLNDTWKNLGTPRQGFFITVFSDIVLPSRPQPVMFLAWFTYDVERPSAGVTAVLGEPGHRWLTAFGAYEGDTATLDIELTQGGIFDSGTPEPTQTPGYGSISVKFTSCSDGVVTYDIPSGGVSGTMPIVRAVPDNAVLCEAFATP
ncbi:MAG: hypothetical protein EXR85_05860, partial [Xanthomonadales bacterium]|nr:hypothetical protein [Xanthomonadales bacterium]